MFVEDISHIEPKLILRRLKFKNFKSFKSVDIELDEFNAIIGANASGKSNFLRIFEFLRDIGNHGLLDAISIHGGIEYFRNIKFGKEKDFSLEMETEYKYPIEKQFQRKVGYIVGIDYKLTIRFKKVKPFFEIRKEKIILKIKTSPKKNQIEEGTLSIIRNKNKVNFDLNLPKSIKRMPEIGGTSRIFESIPSDKTLIESFPLAIVPYAVGYQIITPMDSVRLDLFNQIRLYNFNPASSKTSVPISSKTQLESDGNNLAKVLDYLLQDDEQKRKLSNLIKFILPFVMEINTEKNIDKSVLFKLKEIYKDDEFLPSVLLSDGTISITAIIIALFFESSWLTIIEEPERNLHPYLISKLIELMNDAAKNKQILISTHNPEILRNISIENVLLISRDEDGFSVISKPSEKSQIRTFLENDMGLEDLFIDQILEKLK